MSKIEMQEIAQKPEHTNMFRSKKFEIFENCLYTINQMLIGSTTIYMTWYCFKIGFSQAVAFHALFMTIGYQFLFAEGILTFCRHNFFAYQTTRKIQSRVHLFLQGTGSILAISGVIIETVYRFQVNKSHFQHWHSIFGLISIIFMLISVVSGFAAYYGYELRNYIKPLYAKFIHNVITLTTFITGMVAIVIAYYTKSWLKKLDDHLGDTRYWILSFTIVTILITIISPVKHLVLQTKTVLSRA